MYKIIVFFTAVFTLLISFKGYASDDKYISSLIAKADEIKLSDNRSWDVLLLYKSSALMKKHSLVDDTRFFMAENGETDPEAELHATIRSLFRTDIPLNDNHTLCRFPARAKLLINELNIDTAKLPKAQCAEYDKYIKDVDPTSITLVFPFLYIDNPVSAFGHTLLRINNRSNDPLLSYGVTYAALNTENVNKLLLFTGGFTGYFEGKFTIKQYYKTIFEYSNIDRRDIWEYDLNFTPDEVKQLADHLWEMGDMRIDYYFIDENCSYHLLLLLESARPELRLANSVLWEIPSDSVRVVKENDLIKEINFRPSHTNTLSSIMATLPKDAVTLARDIVKKTLPVSAAQHSKYPDRIKASTLDLAIEMLKFETISTSATEENIANYKELMLTLLSARSAYKMKSDYKVEEGTKPEDGHKPTRILLGVGAVDNKIYTELSLRPAFHSLDDIDTGFIENSRAVMLDTTLHYNISNNYFKFKEVTLFGVGAYIPFSPVIKKPSFKIDVGGKDRSHKYYLSYFTPYISGGTGITLKMFDNAYFFAMADADLSFGKPYEYYVGFGIGASAGVSIAYKYGKILIEAAYLYYPFNHNGGHVAKVSGSYTFPISQNNMLILRYERSYQWGRYLSDIYLKWGFYF